jgi:hypothetical protein
MAVTRKKRSPGQVDETRTLADLSSIGTAMLGDFALLKIRSVEQLAKQDPQRLYDRLCRLTGTRQDPCVLDTFHCAVAQARDPKLPAAQRQWWYWSRKRKAGELTSS